MKKETFECHYCMEGCEFKALNWVWKLSAIFTVLPTGFTPLLAWKNQQYQGQNYCIHQWTCHLNLLQFVASVFAHDVEEICKIWRNLAKFAQDVTRGNSWRKWVVVTSLPALVCILLWLRKPVWWNNIVYLTVRSRRAKLFSGAWLWVGCRAEWVKCWYQKLKECYMSLIAAP